LDSFVYHPVREGVRQLALTFIKNPLIAAVITVAAGSLSGCAVTPDTTVTLDYYQVGGTTLRQIDQEIKNKGPKVNGSDHAVAVANISMTPDISFQPTAGGCMIKRARIKVRATVVLPQWKNRKYADKELAQTWDNLDRYTRLHEAVHVSIAEKHARQIENRLIALKSNKSCEATGEIVKRIIADAMKRHEREQKSFDASEQNKFARLAKSARS